MPGFRHYAAGPMGVVEIESQWTARRREQAGAFPTVGMRSAEEIPTQAKPAWVGHPRELLNADVKCVPSCRRT